MELRTRESISQGLEANCPQACLKGLFVFFSVGLEGMLMREYDSKEARDDGRRI